MEGLSVFACWGDKSSTKGISVLILSAKLLLCWSTAVGSFLMISSEGKVTSSRRRSSWRRLPHPERALIHGDFMLNLGDAESSSKQFCELMLDSVWNNRKAERDLLTRRWLARVWLWWDWAEEGSCYSKLSPQHVHSLDLVSPVFCFQASGNIVFLCLEVRKA